MSKQINRQIQDIINNPGHYNWMEECDCGSQVRHNNGGNYHKKITIDYQNEQWYLRFSDTCELKEQPEWKIVTLKEIRDALKEVFSQTYVRW